MEWQQATADNGQPYWFNTRTRETTWTNPMPQQPPPPQHPPAPQPPAATQLQYNYNHLQVAHQAPQGAQKGLFACVCMLPMGEPPTQIFSRGFTVAPPAVQVPRFE